VRTVIINADCRPVNNMDFNQENEQLLASLTQATPCSKILQGNANSSDSYQERDSESVEDLRSAYKAGERLAKQLTQQTKPLPPLPVNAGDLFTQTHRSFTRRSYGLSGLPVNSEEKALPRLTMENQATGSSLPKVSYFSTQSLPSLDELMTLE
jgi:hypothetical protein